ncbi:hypothetical protein TNCV_671011 [Trichonephila clavipes]|nr:hypothetical protein TNCV_671011 [Trichonephila clavipes]
MLAIPEHIMETIRSFEILSSLDKCPPRCPPFQYGELIEVAGSPRKPIVADSIPAGVDRFSGYENHRHAFHMIMRHVKDNLSTSLALALSEKLNHGNS